MPALHTRAPGALTDVYTSEQFDVGTRFHDLATGKRYVFGYNGGASSTVAGSCVGAFLTTPLTGNFSVTNGTVVETTLGSVTLCAGIALAVIATTEYGWLQVGGYCSSILTDGGIAAGDCMVIDGGTTPTFQADTAIAGEEHGVFALADAADVSTTGSGWLIGCLFDF